MTALTSADLARRYASYSLGSHPEVLAAVAAAREQALVVGLGPAEVECLVQVVAELGANAVRHAGGGELRVEASVYGWVVRAEDRGPGFPSAVLAGAVRGVFTGTAGLAHVRRLAASLELYNLRTGAVAVARGGVDRRRFGPSTPSR